MGATIPRQRVNQTPGPALLILRWIAVLPAAVVAGVVAGSLVIAVDRWGMTMQGLNPGSFFNLLVVNALSGAATGAAWVYAGVKVAPTHKTPVAFILAVLSILGAGFTLFLALAMSRGWAIYSTVWWTVGTSAVAWSIYSGAISEAEL
jgi:hypothetical protein